MAFSSRGGGFPELLHWTFVFHCVFSLKQKNEQNLTHQILYCSFFKVMKKLDEDIFLILCLHFFF